MTRRSRILCLAAILIFLTSCAPSVISLDRDKDQKEAGQAMAATSIPEPTSEPEPTPTDSFFACETDLDCFYEVLESCQQSSFDYSQSLDMMGAVISTTLHIEVLGPLDSACEFSVVTDEVEISFSADAVQQLLDAGQSEEDIEAQRLAMEESQASAGFDEICSGIPGDLIAVLQRWESGKFSMADWDPFTCEGKIFTSADSAPEPTESPPPTAEHQPASAGNLLTNVSFEADPGSVPPTWTSDPKGTDLAADWTMDQAHSGHYSLSLSASETANQGFPGWFMADSIQLEDPVWHLVQVWAYTPDGAGAFVRVEYLDADGGTISYSGQGCKDLESNIWNKIEFGITEESLAGVSAIRVELLQCLTETEGTMTHLYYDDVYLGTTRP